MTSRTRFGATAAAALLVGSLAACGGTSDQSTSSQAPGPATAAPAASDAAGASVVGTEAPATAPPDAGLPGSCSVEVTGGLSASFTSGQDIGEAYVAAWVPGADQAAVGSVLPTGAPSFQLGCTSDDGQSVLLSLYDVDVPLGSASVALAASTVGYYSATGFFGNDSPAEIVLTTFDETRLVGSLTFAGSGPGVDTSTVTMTFDFANPYTG
jgi:hypothetical protein